MLRVMPVAAALCLAILFVGWFLAMRPGTKT